MKKNVLTLLLIIAVLMLSASCTMPDSEGTESSTGDMAGGTSSERLHEDADRVGGLEEGGANPTDNVSIIGTEDVPSGTPEDTFDSNHLETPGTIHENDGLINDLGTAASDALEGVQNGLDDLTTPDSGTNTGISGSNVTPGAGAR